MSASDQPCAATPRPILRFVTREIPTYLRWRCARWTQKRRAAQRSNELTRFATKAAPGVEIAPWCWPIVPKRAGYNAVSLDIYDTATLIRHAIDANHQNCLPRLEPVDFVGDAGAIAELIGPVLGLGRLSYIVSSHNFEHLPDPLRFLRGAAQLLAAGGVLTMALPDKRGSFDYYRPLSTTGTFIEAFFAERRQPTAAQIFEQQALHCCQLRGRTPWLSFSVTDDPGLILPFETVEQAFADWRAARDQSTMPYRDSHCSVFTPASFAAILLDLNYLDLCELRLIEPPVARAGEFIVHLRKPLPDEPKLDRPAYYAHRRRLLRRTMRELARNAPRSWRE